MGTSTADIRLSEGFALDILVEGARLHSPNGLAFGPDGRLYVASVFGESIFAVDVSTGVVDTVVGPFSGESDDLVFTPHGDMIWTALLEGAVRMRTADGALRDLATGLAGANSIALTRDGRRLFVGQVFLGEGLWEIDLAGVAPPRLVVDHTGGLNAFQFGADGLIYAPAWERGQVVRVHPETGRTEVLGEGFGKPGAVRFDAAEQLYVLDDATGELFALDRAGAGWTRRRVARLATATDNMAIGTDGLIYVSNMADGAVHAVDPRTGAVRPVVAPGLGFPRAIAVSTGPEGERVHIADTCAYRTLDPSTGQLADVARAVASPLKFPVGVSVGADRVLLLGEAFGVVQVLNRRGDFLYDVEGFQQPGAVLACADGAMLVSEPSAGRVVRVTDGAREVAADGLQHPIGLAPAPDGGAYVAESGTGRILHLRTAGGEPVPVAQGLGGLRDLAVAPDGRIVALDAWQGRLFVVDPASGAATLVAEGLPVGRLQIPYPRSGGVAVGGDGAIYVAADAANALLRIRRH